MLNRGLLFLVELNNGRVGPDLDEDVGLDVLEDVLGNLFALGARSFLLLFLLVLLLLVTLDFFRLLILGPELLNLDLLDDLGSTRCLKPTEIDPSPTKCRLQLFGLDALGFALLELGEFFVFEINVALEVNPVASDDIDSLLELNELLAVLLAFLLDDDRWRDDNFLLFFDGLFLILLLILILPLPGHLFLYLLFLEELNSRMLVFIFKGPFELLLFV